MINFILKSSLLLTLLVSCEQRPRTSSAFYKYQTTEPSTLHGINGMTDGGASSVQEYVLESMATKNPHTYEWEPALARKWSISKNKQKMTFYLRQGVLWHDGVELTSADIVFSYNAIFDNKYKATAIRGYFEDVISFKAIDKYTVEVKTQNALVSNLTQLLSMTIVPQHFYNQEQKKSFFNKNLTGTGPYKLKLYKRGNRVVLEKNKDWWGRKIYPDKHNFPKVVIRFVKDRNVALEMLKRGALDFLGLTPEFYLKKAVGPRWGKDLIKVKTKNKTPKGYNFIGWNMKHPILKSKDVRHALYMLVNRELMIEKFEYGMSEKLTGPVYPSSPYALESKPVEYAPKKALNLLRDRGWRDTNGNNILDKVIDGKRRELSITILEPSEEFSKYLTVFKEDARKMGVEINIKIMEWNSFIKLIDERKFDAIRLAWSAMVDWDPTQIWSSKSIKGGSNFIGFSNKRVDEISMLARKEFDKEKRIKLLKEAQKLIIDEHPYVWFTSKSETLYGHTGRVIKERDTLPYTIGSNYWKFKKLAP